MQTRSLLIGIDSGTQSTKTLVVDATTGKVLGSASSSYELIDGLPAGAKEQDPSVWVKALVQTVRAALKAAHATASEVVGIGVSGQDRKSTRLNSSH